MKYGLLRRFSAAWIGSLGIALLLAVCAWPGVARAQVNNSGQITGTVFDPSGKTIPNAEVTITNPSTNFSQTVKASATGSYAFPALQAGPTRSTSCKPIPI
ncbi:MAG TPA: carboxypeptidase-like regulatory domain-containing protein [Candidatus Acidoferrales bacterium]|nr:carboxypeptidase-like regulatory domain-containing protein [Candidatus Acidoferrales bacterium]